MEKDFKGYQTRGQRGARALYPSLVQISITPSDKLFLDNVPLDFCQMISPDKQPLGMRYLIKRVIVWEKRGKDDPGSEIETALGVKK